MDKPKLYLHIGSPKTGTTSFQHCLSDNFDSFFNELDIYYPFCERDAFLTDFRFILGADLYFSINEVRHNNGQRILFSDNPFLLLEEISRVASERQVDVVISDESLSYSHPCSPFVIELRRLFDVVPVVVIRDPLEYVFSLYLETVKLSPYSGSFDDYVGGQPGCSIQFPHYKEWCEAFDNLKVIPFKTAKEDLIGSLLKSFGCSSTELMPYSENFAERTNVSLGAECYDVIRRFNKAGLPVLARKFASLYEVSSLQGSVPRPDPAYFDAALAIHAGLFGYLQDRFGLLPALFTSTPSSSWLPEMDCTQKGISSGGLDVLISAVKEYVFADCGDREVSAASNQSLSSVQTALARIAGTSKEDSPWGRYCPDDFSAEDYVTLGALLNSRPYEELGCFDPFLHYVMYGRYGGCAIKRCYSIEEQVSVFGNSPFTGYVPDDFDAGSYLRMNADVHTADVDPYHHYWAYGIKEGRAYR